MRNNSCGRSRPLQLQAVGELVNEPLIWRKIIIYVLIIFAGALKS